MTFFRITKLFNYHESGAKNHRHELEIHFTRSWTNITYEWSYECLWLQFIYCLLTYSLKYSNVISRKIPFHLMAYLSLTDQLFNQNQWAACMGRIYWISSQLWMVEYHEQDLKKRDKELTLWQDEPMYVCY